jgi:hypothetical protein
MHTNYEDVLTNLKKSADKFAQDLTDLNNQNNHVKESTEKLLDTIQKLVGDKTCCKICYNRPPTHALQPCYHAGFCVHCAQRAMNRGRCDICRTPIESVVKIYM